VLSAAEAGTEVVADVVVTVVSVNDVDGTVLNDSVMS